MNAAILAKESKYTVRRLVDAVGELIVMEGQMTSCVGGMISPSALVDQLETAIGALNKVIEITTGEEDKNAKLARLQKKFIELKAELKANGTTDEQIEEFLKG